MTPSEPPSNGELSRRMDDMRGEIRAGHRAINERLDKMPTNELLLAYLAKTDAEVATVKEDVAEVKGEFAGFKKSVADAKRWAIGTALACGSFLIAALGLIRSFIS